MSMPLGTFLPTNTHERSFQKLFCFTIDYIQVAKQLDLFGICNLNYEDLQNFRFVMCLELNVGILFIRV
jgi:hypothetical protein